MDRNLILLIDIWIRNNIVSAFSCKYGQNAWEEGIFSMNGDECIALFNYVFCRLAVNQANTVVKEDEHNLSYPQFSVKNFIHNYFLVYYVDGS